MFVFISYLCFVPCLFLFLTFVLYHVCFYFLPLFCTMFVFISYLCFERTWYKPKVRNKNKHGTKKIRNKNKHGTKQRYEIKTNMVQNKGKKCTMFVFISYLCFVSCLFLFLTFVLYHVCFYFLPLLCTMFVFISYLCVVPCLFLRNKNKHGTKQR
jgi:Flp pilus assembly protein TadB